MELVTIHARRELHGGNVLQKILLFSGVLSSLLYLFANVICAMLYEGYSSVSQTVSELSAIGAPTRPLWVWLMIPFSLLVIAFGWGVYSASSRKSLRIVGMLFIVDSIIGFFWPPMHQRAVLAAGGGTWTDTMHIVFTFIHIPLVIVAIGFGAVSFGKRFRAYSIITLVILIVAGVFTGIDSPNIQTDMPTPWIGVWERIIIGVYMLWIVVLAVLLLRKHQIQSLSIKNE